MSISATSIVIIFIQALSPFSVVAFFDESYIYTFAAFITAISSVVFDARIGCLERDPAPEVRMFINGVLDFFKYSFKTLTQPEIMTKYNLSDNYNKLSQAFKTIFVYVHDLLIRTGCVCR